MIQGGLEPDLREASTRFIASMPFDGINIGGLAGDETPIQRRDTIDLVVGLLADDPRPRYLMGLGSPADLLDAVDQGIDLFDSVLPSRVARTGQAWVPGGKLNLRNAALLDDPTAARGGLPVPRVPPVLQGLHRPPVPGEGAPRVPAGHAPQPHVHARFHGPDPCRPRRRDLPGRDARAAAPSGTERRGRRCDNGR